MWGPNSTGSPQEASAGLGYAVQAETVAKGELSKVRLADAKNVSILGRSGQVKLVAEHDADIVGFSCGAPLQPTKHGFDSELAAVYLRRDFQRAGLGRRLVGAVVEARRAQAATGLLTWVIAGNRGARAFYEGLGGELIVEQPFQWDGMDLVEAGYVWRDLNVLVAACEALESTAR